jgi:enoyl-[acyl-carrier protein] reductase/trans-2-enoyl-CoA reductase (NAD+)
MLLLFAVWFGLSWYTRHIMEIVLPRFQFRFMKAQGNVIFPGNFHPVGTQRAAEQMVSRALDGQTHQPSTARWLLVGGSGGFGSAARVALGCDLGAHTLSVSYDGQPNPESNNKIRKIGSPGWHRNAAIERSLQKLGLHASSLNGDAFDPAFRRETVEAIKERFDGGKIDGLVWALAAPRGLDPRTGKPVSSVLKPMGNAATIRTFTGADKDQDPVVDELVLEPGTPEEAIRTQFVMGGRIVEQWIDLLAEADVLAEGFTLLTISYRGGPLNEAIYHKGLIGLAKAELEFYTRALDKLLADRVGGRAIAVEGPAVVTEASGGIPGVPFYMALTMGIMKDRFEDPLDSMRRMFRENFIGEAVPTLDEEGLLRMDDRELSEEVQAPLRELYEQLTLGATFPRDRFDAFMSEYAKTRGFNVEGVDYDAPFDTDIVCRVNA